MAQFINWGSGKEGNLTISAGNLGGVGGFGVATFTGTSGNNYGTFSDVGYFNGGNGGRVGDLCIIHQSQGTGAGNWEIVKISNRSGTTVYFDRNLTNTYVSGAQIQSAPNLNGGTISGNLHPYTAWNGSTGGIIFIVDKGTLTVSGSIVATGFGFRGGPKDGGAGMVGYCGEDIDSGWNRQTGANGISGGGGNENGASDAKPGGGGGGHATGGANGVSNESPGVYGAGGGTIGVANLTTIYFGGAGGQGAYWHATGATMNPGEGGGIFFIFARNIVITGSINVGGSNGASSSAAGGACGGGAGGSVLLKCETATLGTNLIVAPGGSGGSGDSNNGAGGNGGVGRIHMDYSKSYTGSTNPTLSSAQDLTLTVPEGGNFIPFFI